MVVMRVIICWEWDAKVVSYWLWVVSYVMQVAVWYAHHTTTSPIPTVPYVQIPSPTASSALLPPSASNARHHIIYLPMLAQLAQRDAWSVVHLLFASLAKQATIFLLIVVFSARLHIQVVFYAISLYVRYVRVATIWIVGNVMNVMMMVVRFVMLTTLPNA